MKARLLAILFLFDICTGTPVKTAPNTPRIPTPKIAPDFAGTAMNAAFLIPSLVPLFASAVKALRTPKGAKSQQRKTETKKPHMVHPRML
jgi:hypothetical protein